MLPLGKAADVKIDSVFGYNQLGKAIKLEEIDKRAVAEIFSRYDFSKPMPNFFGDDPTPLFSPRAIAVPAF